MRPWHRTASFRHRDTRRLQHEVVVLVRLDGPGTHVDETERLAYEKEHYIAYRSAPVQDITASAEPFYPGRLPEMLPDLLAEIPIQEPFELWS
jgi:hypothetical protein